MAYLSAWAKALYGPGDPQYATAAKRARWGTPLTGGQSPGPATNAGVPPVSSTGGPQRGYDLAPGDRTLRVAAGRTPLLAMALAGHVTTMRGTGYWYVPSYVNGLPGMSPVGVITTRMSPLASNPQLIQYLFPGG